MTYFTELAFSRTRDDLTAQIQTQRPARIQDINNLEDARPWVLLAYGGYVRDSQGSDITVDYRKIRSYMTRHQGEFPVTIMGGEDSRILGMVLDEMSEAKLTTVREWQCQKRESAEGCGTVFSVDPTKANICPKCNTNLYVSPHNRSNGGVLYQVVRPKPLKPIPGATMVKVNDLEPPEVIIRNPGNIISLMASIQEHGLRTPVSARKHRGRVQIVDGFRRYQAIKCLGVVLEVPCLIDPVMDDRTAYEVSGLSNLERLAMQPLEEARFYQGYIDKGWGDIPYISKKFSRSENTVRARLDLLINPAALQRALENRLIDQRMGTLSAEFIKDAPNKKEQQERSRKVEELTSKVVEEKEIPLSSVPAVLAKMEKNRIGVESAIELVKEEAEARDKAQQEGQTLITEYVGRPREEFACPSGCGVTMAVDWERRAIYALPAKPQLRA